MNNFKTLILHELNGKVAKNLKQLDKNNAERNAAIQYLAKGNDVKTLRELPADVIKSVLWRNPKLYDVLTPEQKESDVIKQAQQEIQIKKDLDPQLIQQIKDPSIELQNYIVNKNPEFIQYINNPSFEAQKRAVTYNPSFIQYIKSPSEEILEIAKSAKNPIEMMKDMCKDGNVIKNLAIAAVSNDKRALQILLDSPTVDDSIKRDSGILKSAIAADPSAIEYLFDHGLATEEYQRFAIDQNPNIIYLMDDYFNLKDLKLVQYARNQKKKMDDINKQNRIKQINEDPFIIDYLKDVTPEEEEIANNKLEQIKNNVIPYALNLKSSSSNKMNDFIVQQIVNSRDKTPELRNASAHVLSINADDPEIKYQLLKKFPNIIGSIPDDQMTPQDVLTAKNYGGESVIEEFLLSNMIQDKNGKTTSLRNLPTDVQRAMLYNGNAVNHNIIKLLKYMDTFNSALLYSDRDINPYKTQGNDQEIKYKDKYKKGELDYDSQQIKNLEADKQQKIQQIRDEYNEEITPLFNNSIKKVRAVEKKFANKKELPVDEIFSKEALSQAFNYNTADMDPKKLQLLQYNIEEIYKRRDEYYNQWVEKIEDLGLKIIDQFDIKDNYKQTVAFKSPNGKTNQKVKTTQLKFDKTPNEKFLDVSTKSDLDDRFKFYQGFLAKVKNSMNDIQQTIRYMDTLIEYPWSAIDIPREKINISKEKEIISRNNSDNKQDDEEERKRQALNPSMDYIRQLRSQRAKKAS